MTFLFRSGSLREKLEQIWSLTYQHSRNLAMFVFLYKTLTLILREAENEKKQFHSFIAAFVGGYYVFGKNTGVNNQINLYLFSRILVGLAKVLVKKKYLPEPQMPVFPLFSAAVWGTVLWLFEYHRETLQSSLRSSMTYLYDDSSIWHGLQDFLWFNKPGQR